MTNIASLWWACNVPTSPLNEDILATAVLIIPPAVCFGFGLTRFVQSTVSLATRQQIIRFGHCTGLLCWMVCLTSCQRFLFPILVGQTFLWGSEPYDDVFNSSLWENASREYKKGSWIHYYWLISSLFIHAWFVAGAAFLMFAIAKPASIFVMIYGFAASHIARLLAYEYYDKAASWFEICGICLLTLAVVIEYLQYDSHNRSAMILIWQLVSVLERYTHLPAAFNYDAGWMRSYDLWLQLTTTDNHQDSKDNHHVEFALDFESVQTI